MNGSFSLSRVFSQLSLLLLLFLFLLLIVYCHSKKLVVLFHLFVFVEVSDKIAFSIVLIEQNGGIHRGRRERGIT